MPELIALVQANVGGLVIISLGLTVMALVFALIAILRSQRLTKKFNVFVRGTNKQNLEKMLLEHLTLQEETGHHLTAIDQRLAELAATMEETVRHIGVVRFNAFSNVGSDQSFSVALLDNQVNGVVFTSLYGREFSQVFAKPVSGGKSSYLLTREEQEAIAQALGRQ
ncbi:MAG: DUF4446 family protein [Heliobacteriaceae bacterium]|nr:DUF4446 family protein [Heliobacteriaceae bacterium]MDD4587671.1 DUF4446 family protein [Heliobacteriaceae bacterium]